MLVSNSIFVGNVDILVFDVVVDFVIEIGVVGFEIVVNDLNIVSWCWNFGNGFISEFLVLSYIYIKVGCYLVSVVVEMVVGCSEFVMFWIDVIDSILLVNIIEDIVDFNFIVFFNLVGENLFLFFKFFYS